MKNLFQVYTPDLKPGDFVIHYNFRGIITHIENDGEFSKLDYYYQGRFRSVRLPNWIRIREVK